MKFLKRKLLPRETKDVLAVLDEAKSTDNSLGFKIVHDHIETIILKHSKVIAKKIRGGSSPKEYVYGMIVNTAGDFLESGQFHLDRGVLTPSPVGGGEDILRVFDSAADVMVEVGAVDQEFADEQKRAIRRLIMSAG